MKVLLDACVPRPLRNFLSVPTIYTAQEMMWGKLKNGALPDEAEANFDVFISTDQNLKFQQKVTDRRLAILILPTNDWPAIRSKTSEIAAKVEALKPGDFVELDWG